MPDIGFINGQFLPLEEAKVSIDDRGFQFGDGVYEVIRTYGGRPFELQAHLTRLQRSAQALFLPNPYSDEEWSRYLQRGIERAGYCEAKIYIQVTRGVAPRDHVFPGAIRPTAVMTIREIHDVDPRLRQEGVTAITLDDFRWGRCDIKSLNLLANVLARQRAKEAGVFEAIFVKGGLVTEGSVSNLMVIRGGRLVTEPEGPRILSGVTRTFVLDLARQEGIPLEERSLSIEELYLADEVFLTGTTVEILPVISIDGRSIGVGKPGVLTRRLYDRFQSCAH
jgi:D-alanine transaminase